MNEMTKIKLELEDRLRDLNARIHGIDDDLSEPPDADWSENAVESENDEVLEEVGELAVEEIQKIKAALSKIEAGTYGICDMCDEMIAIKRLEALPHATTCIKCAS